MFCPTPNHSTAPRTSWWLGKQGQGKFFEPSITRSHVARFYWIWYVMVHDGPVIRADNKWRSGGTGSLKWQCRANCHFLVLNCFYAHKQQQLNNHYHVNVFVLFKLFRLFVSCLILALNVIEEACYRYCHSASIVKPNDVHVLSQNDSATWGC